MELGLFKLLPQIVTWLELVDSEQILINKTLKSQSTDFVGDMEYSPNTCIFPDYQYFYDDELREMVYKLYQEDFENCGYKKYEV